MRGTWIGIGCMLLLLGIAGCVTTDSHLRPPEKPDEFVDPPDDKRYQTPPEPPKSANPDGTPKPGGGQKAPGGLPSSPSRPGAPGGPGSPSGN